MLRLDVYLQDGKVQSYSPLNDEYNYTALDVDVSTTPALTEKSSETRCPTDISTPGKRPLGLVDDDVRWSVMAPTSVSPECTFTVNVHSYLRQHRDIVLNKAKRKDHVEKGMHMEDTSLVRGAPVTVVLYFNDGRISIDREEAAMNTWKKNLWYSSSFRKFSWTGEPHECEFSCRADFADLDLDEALFAPGLISIPIILACWPKYSRHMNNDPP